MTDGPRMIPFTQFMRPNGRAVAVQAPMPLDYEKKIADILDYGWMFECEVLTTGDVSLTVSDGTDDIAIVLSINGPEIEDALVALIDKAFSRLPKISGMVPTL